MGAPPRWDWIQVEITSYCNAACVYCPRTRLAAYWQNRHMSLGAFQRLLPALSQTRLVHLQGWGEPFLNPDFLDMLRLVKKAGCLAGTTTNGLVLNRPMIESLVDNGLDLMAFSLAGTGPVNDRIRLGTSWESILKTIKEVTQVKKEKQSARPSIHIAYMLLRSGLDDLDCLPELFSGLGIDQIIISTLDFLPSPDLRSECLLTADQKEYSSWEAKLTTAVEVGRSQGLSIYHRLPHPGVRPAACSENVPKAVVVAVDGLVAPCVYNNLPLSTPCRIGTISGEAEYHRYTLGNLADQSLEDIWQDPVYREFRTSFTKGHIPGPCKNCLKLTGS